jgi:ribosome-associated protein
MFEGNVMKTEELEKIALDALNDLKAVDIVTLDIRDITTIADTMIICSGRSSRHVQSIAASVITDAKKNKVTYINFEGESEGEWIVVDLGDVIVHVMQAVAREFYNLEDLWEPIQMQRERKAN